MDSLQNMIQQFTPGAAGVWTGVAMFAAYMLREWRETRKLSYEDRLARREGYAKQVEFLTEENRALQHDQQKLREEYDRYRRLCQQETDQLRTDIQHHETRTSGMVRKLADIAIRAARGEVDSTLAVAIEQLVNEWEA